MGDATNLVIILAGELLKKAEHLLVMGLHPSEVIKGYELACKKAISELESLLFFPRESCLSADLDDRSLHGHPSHTLYSRVSIHCSQTGHRIKTIWR